MTEILDFILDLSSIWAWPVALTVIVGTIIERRSK